MAMRPRRSWDFFHWLTFLSVAWVFLGWLVLLTATLANLMFDLGWALGWRGFWSLVGFFVFGAPLSLLLLAVQGLFDHPEGDI